MSMRSDVSKMLIRQQPLPPTADGGFGGGPMSAAGFATTGRGGVGPSGASPSPSPPQPGLSASGGALGGGAAARGASRTPLGYLVAKAQDLLRQAGRELLTHEVLLGLGAERSSYSETELLQRLREVPTVVYNTETRRWLHRASVSGIDGPESLKLALKDRPEFAQGMEITQEILAHHPDMADWVAALLATRQVRAIRATRNVRCKNYTVDSGLQCQLHEVNKCDACSSLKGVVLYPLEGDHVEGVHLDEDVRGLWLEVAMPSLDAMLEETQASRRGAAGEQAARKRRRKPGAAAKGRGGRASKILNTHIYSVEDFQEEAAAAAAADS